MNTSRPTIWFFSPCYMDFESYLQLRAKIIQELEKLPKDSIGSIRFCLVDDTGDQDTKLLKESLPQDIQVISPPFNLGHQRALVYGLRSQINQITEADYVVTLDSDGEDRPDDLPRLLAPLLQDTRDVRKVVIARRTKRRESLTFKLMYFCFKILFRSLTGDIIRSGNYAAYRGWTVHHVLMHPHFDLCYSSSLISLNLKITTVPCERGSRYAGQSRMNFQKLILHGIRMLMPFIDRIATRALILFASTTALGFAIAACILCGKFFFNAIVPSWLIDTLVLIVGLSLISLGQLISLLAIVSQSQGIALSGLDKKN